MKIPQAPRDVKNPTLLAEIIASSQRRCRCSILPAFPQSDWFRVSTSSKPLGSIFSSGKNGPLNIFSHPRFAGSWGSSRHLFQVSLTLVSVYSHANLLAEQRSR